MRCPAQLDAADYRQRAAQDGLRVGHAGGGGGLLRDDVGEHLEVLFRFAGQEREFLEVYPLGVEHWSEVTDFVHVGWRNEGGDGVVGCYDAGGEAEHLQGELVGFVGRAQEGDDFGLHVCEHGGEEERFGVFPGDGGEGVAVLQAGFGDVEEVGGAHFGVGLRVFEPEVDGGEGEDEVEQEFVGEGPGGELVDPAVHYLVLEVGGVGF